MNAATPLASSDLLAIYDLMVQSRILEEQLIKMFKQGHGFFWIGGPGEEAFNVPLGKLIKKGQGLDYDFLHLHYRSNAVLLAMGMDPVDPIRQMRNTAADTHSGGRNFCGHLSKPEWNLTPITSPIEVQYVTAIGTGIAQRDHKTDAITIVTGGDAGTAEGDFASCLVWSTRPGQELPILIIVTNNQGGISTPYATQHAERHIADRAKAFGMKTNVIDGNDVMESYAAIAEAMHYVRTERKPFLLEANVSRLYGHSSASGANFQAEEDPIARFRECLIQQNVLDVKSIKEIEEKHTQAIHALISQVLMERMPDPASIFDYIYWQQKGRVM